MDNDLISRKAVIELINELGYVNCHDGKDYEANSRVDKIRQRVIELPTAYDVDKVVERLKEMRDTAARNIELNSQGSDVKGEILAEARHYQNIIQIAKAGMKEESR